VKLLTDLLAECFSGPESRTAQKRNRAWGVLGISTNSDRLCVAGQSELLRLLTEAPAEEPRLILGGTPAAAFAVEGNEKMFGSINAVTQVHTKALEYIHARPGLQFSIREWVAGGKGVLFLPYQADQIAALRSIISTWMRIAIFDTMSRGERDRRIWFTIDELDALGSIDGLKDALARLRKFGGRCVLGFQSIAQVRGLYGDAEAQTIVENCGNTLILRCSARERGGTAEFASRLIGERELVRKQITHSRSGGLFDRPNRSVSESLQHVNEPAVLPAEIEQLPDLTGYLKTASSPAWRKVLLRVGH
jgi:type IV secretory pathway TraG/TraD family ATPase VirD4